MLTVCQTHLNVERGLLEAITRHCPPGTRLAEDLAGCVPHLVGLLNESHDISVDHMLATVRSIVRDRCCVHAAESVDFEQVDQVITILIREMEQLRRSEVQRGDWSDIPVPPQMFG